MSNTIEPKPWHEEALRLHATGMRAQQVAKAVGIARQTVRFFLDEDGEREKVRARARGKKRDRGTKRYERSTGAQASPYYCRPTREPQPSDGKREAMIRDAALAFARNEITREQLSQRLRGG